MALTGRANCFEKISQSSSAAEPLIMEAGTNTRLSDVEKAPRATCGIARPKKPIGPQKAVTRAVSMPESDRMM